MGYGHNALNLAGIRFGHLVALHRDGRIKRAAAWLCQCDCGNQIRRRADRLSARRTSSCGTCDFHYPAKFKPSLRRDHASEYNSWESMWKRVTDKKRHNWAAYGARGITVCKAWEDFATFFRDMGTKPTKQHTIERKNNDGNYEPSNCRWATRAEQYRNMQRSVFVVYEGEQMLLTDLTAKLGLSRSVVYGRLNNGWTIEESITTPVRPHKPRKKYRKQKARASHGASS